MPCPDRDFSYWWCKLKIYTQLLAQTVAVRNKLTSLQEHHRPIEINMTPAFEPECILFYSWNPSR